MAFIAPYVAGPPIDDFGLAPSKLKYSATLGAGVETILEVPGDSERYKVIFRVEPGTNREVWFALNETAAIPAGSSPTLTASELIPSGKKVCREVRAGEFIHIITSFAATQVGIVLYGIQ